MPLDVAAESRTEFFDYARCKEIGASPSVFYPAVETEVAATTAKAICSVCPVRIACLEYALNMETDGAINGIWGGKTERERRKLIEHRPIPIRYCARGHAQTPDVTYRMSGETRCRLCVQEARVARHAAAQKMREYRKRQRNAG